MLFLIAQVEIFRYAIACDKAQNDPTVNLKGSLKPVPTRHHSAITEPENISGLMRAIDGYQGTFIVKCALQLSPLFFVRPGELRQAEWSEIDLGAALLHYTQRGKVFVKINIARSLFNYLQMSSIAIRT